MDGRGRPENVTQFIEGFLIMLQCVTRSGRCLKSPNFALRYIWTMDSPLLHLIRICLRYNSNCTTHPPGISQFQCSITSQNCLCLSVDKIIVKYWFKELYQVNLCKLFYLQRHFFVYKLLWRWVIFSWFYLRTQEAIAPKSLVSHIFYF